LTFLSPFLVSVRWPVGLGSRPSTAASWTSESDWIVPEEWLYLYYPARKHMSAGLRAVIEAMRVGGG